MTLHERNISASIDPVKLDRLAEVAIRVGLNLQPGQDLLLTAPIVALPLVRQDRRACLQGRRRPRDADPVRRGDHAGALPLRPGRTASTAPPAGSMRAWRRRSPPTPRGSPSSATIRCCWRARTPPRSSRANKANSIAYQPALEKIAGFDINWNIVAYPSPAWAKQVFPGDEEDVAVAKLADAIFAASRVDNDDAGRGLGGAQRRAARAHRMAERPALHRAAIFRTGHRSHGRPRRRP